jgi:hypothetical protein
MVTPLLHWKAIQHLMASVGGEQLYRESWWLITEQTAKRLSSKLPRPGYEKLVAIEDVHFWLARTPHQQQLRWSLRWGRGWRNVGSVSRLGQSTFDAENQALDRVAEKLCS